MPQCLKILAAGWFFLLQNIGTGVQIAS